MQPAYALYRWLWRSLDWLYPPFCGGCNQPGTRWCVACQAAVVKISEPVCPVCGCTSGSELVCEQCQGTLPPFTAARSWGLFGGTLRKAIHRLKYKGDLGLAEKLAEPLIEIVQRTDWKIDLVLPVPMGRRRAAERGYNQAALLARPLAYALNISYKPGGLQKIRETRSQVGLTLPQRIANVEQAYAAESRLTSGKSVLVVDDVMTSGATLAACATSLRQGGANEVYCLTLARVY